MIQEVKKDRAGYIKDLAKKMKSEVINGYEGSVQIFRPSRGFSCPGWIFLLTVNFLHKIELVTVKCLYQISNNKM